MFEEAKEVHSLTFVIVTNEVAFAQAFASPNYGSGPRVMYLGHRVPAAAAHAVLTRWVLSATSRCVASLVVPEEATPGFRSVAMDMASLKAVIGVFSEWDDAAAEQHALREWRLSWASRAVSRLHAPAIRTCPEGLPALNRAGPRYPDFLERRRAQPG